MKSAMSFCSRKREQTSLSKNDDLVRNKYCRIKYHTIQIKMKANLDENCMVLRSHYLALGKKVILNRAPKNKISF